MGAIQTLQLDPVSRVEGHLRVDIDVQDGRVVSAHSSGTSFRGIESVMVGRDPRQACQITQRVCGVCPIPQARAACEAFESAASVTINAQARLLRNIIQAANFIDSHLLSFYALSLPDFVAGLVGAGNWPQNTPPKAWKGGESVDVASLQQHIALAWKARRACHSLGAIVGGRMPHPVGIVPGGATTLISSEQIQSGLGLVTEILDLVQGPYATDIQTLRQAYPAYESLGASGAAMLSFGAFPEDDGKKLFASGVVLAGSASPQAFDPETVQESVASSAYRKQSPQHPSVGDNVPDLSRSDAYSFIKSPRLAGTACEVGPLARAILNGTADSTRGVWARHSARQKESVLLAQRIKAWLSALQPKEPACPSYPAAPAHGQGYGLVDAPRGALGHWLEITNHAVSHYAIVSPTTWNASPRDDQGQCGPLEAALANTPVADASNPIEVYRVIHSFDPCLQCAVH